MAFTTAAEASDRARPTTSSGLYQFGDDGRAYTAAGAGDEDMHDQVDQEAWLKRHVDTHR
jgi:hypothetical protein